MATKIKAPLEENQSRLRPKLRQGVLAYVGIYGLAYDRFQMRREQAKTLTENLFGDLTEKGETTVKQAELLLKRAQKGAWKNYAGASEKLTEAMPVKIKSRVEVMEEELSKLQETFDRLSKTAAIDAKKVKKPAVKKTTLKKTPAKKTTAKPAAKTIKAPVTVSKVDIPVIKTETKVVPVSTPAPQKLTEPAPTPRHISYFLDVKRYDPLASEDVVRKIVNHCGIALRSEDAKYVACSDESERATVRDSWLKRKLSLAGPDADLDKKVLAVCDLMQRDQKKNRVTFYYLLAKKEQQLDNL